MEKKLIAIILLVLFFTGIHHINANGHQGSEVTNFSDMDMFSLQGIRKLGPNPAYPYVTILAETSNSKKISYCVNSKLKIEKTYKKIKNYWTTTYIEKGDTSTEKVFEYVLPDKIIKLNYLISDEDQISYIREVTVFENWNETMYLIDSDRKVAPGIHVPDVVMSHARITHKKKIIIKNGVLTLSEQTYEAGKKLVANRKTCYPVGSKSYFQWLRLNLEKKEITCN